MHTFLEDVARRLYDKYRGDISSLTLVVPSKRARHFFAEALSKIAECPVWEPRYISIDELMSEASALRAADKLTLLTELHIVYSKYHGETFDKFYQWGELLLSDFDMVDKYMVDAAQLYANISELKEIESNVDYLTKEQKAAITAFWGAIYGEDGNISQFKRRFLEVWKSLGAIYEEFRERLVERGIGYTGMVYRRAVERLKSGEAVLSSGGRYVFAGFNALSTCERRLLDYIAKNCQCDFFWDYDNYYVRNESQEAGRFIRESLATLPSEGVACDTLLCKEKVTVASTSTNVAQCRYAVRVLQEIAEREGRLDKDTAVVLTDENLLMPLLYALPESLKMRTDERGKQRSAINVTMGYPLRQTSVHPFVMRLLDLQAHSHGEGEEAEFYYVDVEGLLLHPYVADAHRAEVAAVRGDLRKNRLFRVPQSNLCATPLLRSIFRRVDGATGLLDYLGEVIAAVVPTLDDATEKSYLAVAAETLAKLRNTLVSCSVAIPDDVCRALVRRALQDERIAFTGEPLEGLQIMGILESRNLDFRNVIILSMSDDNFPGTRTSDQSFIPQSLRFAYELPTPEHHDGVHAYYFYRLIQRAKNVHLVYCSHADDKSSGEPSRYIHQLNYESGLKLHRVKVGVDVAGLSVSAIEVEKSDAVMAVLERYLDGSAKLSPTAFSQYLECPLQFYFKYVAGLYVDDELVETVDHRVFGNIFHAAAEIIYGKMKGEASAPSVIGRYGSPKQVEAAVDEAIAKTYFNRKDGRCPALSGDLIIVRNIVIRYLHNVLKYDGSHEDFSVVALERKIAYNFPLQVDGRERELCFGGKADRIDSLANGLMRVVDYKTGTPMLEYGGVEKMLRPEPLKNIVNTMLYAMMISHAGSRDVVPALYYVGSMQDEEYSPLFIDTSVKPGLVGVSYRTIAEEFEGAVRAVLEQLYDRSVPFRPCEGGRGCSHCDFKGLCGVEKKY